MQVKSTKLNQECEHLSSVKEHLSLQNQQSANELKVHIRPPYLTQRACSKKKEREKLFYFGL